MMIPPSKPLSWTGSSRQDLRNFPKDLRQKAGQELRRVQLGEAPLDWKPMQGIGSGVREIRVHTRLEHRVIYIARFEEAIYVLHAFEKRSRKTPRSDIETARRRLASVLDRRTPRSR